MEAKIKKVLCTTWIPDECLKQFEGVFDITYPREGSEDFTYEKVINMVWQYDALFVLKGFMCDRKIIDAGTNLKVIASQGIGYGNIDVARATEKGVFVLNTPIGFCEATAEFSISLIMSAIRGIAWYDRESTNMKSEVFDSIGTRNTFLYGKTLGIIGFGSVGKAVARKALSFGMKIIYNDITRSSVTEEEDLYATYMSFDELLETADVVTCHFPGIEENKYIINVDTFKKMKDTAYFINATHGHIVSEFDLLEALKKKEIRAAAIDIHEFLSKISDEIASLENVIIIPHIASVAYQSRVNMSLEIFNAIKLLSEDQLPHNIVNREVLNISLESEDEELQTTEENTEAKDHSEEKLANFNSAVNEALIINDAEFNEKTMMNEQSEEASRDQNGEIADDNNKDSNEEAEIAESSEELTQEPEIETSVDDRQASENIEATTEETNTADSIENEEPTSIYDDDEYVAETVVENSEPVEAQEPEVNAENNDAIDAQVAEILASNGIDEQTEDLELREEVAQELSKEDENL